jgi:hypothetical protein
VQNALAITEQQCSTAPDKSSLDMPSEKEVHAAAANKQDARKDAMQTRMMPSLFLPQYLELF